MRHGSLFSGIGGFDLASEWMGWENVFHCEWNTFGQKVLKYYWPKAITYNDITKTDFSIHRGKIDIITGGFPCQPYSMAGKRKGKEDERHLWPEMLRAIREIQPAWVVGENVLGLVNWDGGLVFEEVQAELEAQGYEVQPYILPAASVNAPHRRDRVWFVAFNAKSSRNSKVGKVCEGKNNESIGIRNSNIERSFINTDHKGRGARPGQVQGKDGEVSEWDNNAESSDSSIQSDASDSDCQRYNEQSTIQNNSQEWQICQEEQSIGDRIWSEASGHCRIITNSNCIRWNNRLNNWEERQICTNQGASKENKSEWERRECGTREISTNLTDTNCFRQKCRKERERSKSRTESYDKFIKRCDELSRADFEMFPTSAPICFGDDGISDRLDTITFPKWRNESIKAGGNAIVPQVVYQIFKAIEQYNNLNK